MLMISLNGNKLCKELLSHFGKFDVDFIRLAKSALNIQTMPSRLLIMFNLKQRLTYLYAGNWVIFHFYSFFA